MAAGARTAWWSLTGAYERPLDVWYREQGSWIHCSQDFVGFADQLEGCETVQGIVRSTEVWKEGARGIEDGWRK
jgi:hypothetical protein